MKKELKYKLLIWSKLEGNYNILNNNNNSNNRNNSDNYSNVYE